MISEKISKQSFQCSELNFSHPKARVDDRLCAIVRGQKDVKWLFEKNPTALYGLLLHQS